MKLAFLLARILQTRKPLSTGAAQLQCAAGIGIEITSRRVTQYVPLAPL